MKILVMRPSPSGEELVNNLNKCNIKSWHYSLFTFASSFSEKSLSKKITQFYQASIILVFSKMSVYYTNLYLQNNNLEWPTKVKYYAIGRSTANLLNKYVKKQIIFPKKKENSEELLNILYKNIIKNNIKKENIVLLQGENGRNFIQRQLCNKGFKIHLIECYKRILKILDIYGEVKKWRLYGINTFMITNGETLIELKKIFSNTNQITWLLGCTIFVISKRLLILARKLGWKKVFVSNYANNHFLIKFIQKKCHQFRIFSAKEDLNL